MKRMMMIGGLLTALIGGSAFAYPGDGRYGATLPPAPVQAPAFARPVHQRLTFLGQAFVGGWRGAELGINQRLSKLMIVSHTPAARAVRVTLAGGQSFVAPITGDRTFIDVPGYARRVQSVAFLGGRGFRHGRGMVEVFGQLAGPAFYRGS
jgi:hypothetical protein